MTRTWKYVSLLVMAMVMVTTIQATAYRVGDIVNVQLRDARRFVTNPDGILSPEAVASLDSICYSLKAQGIAEVAIVAVRDIYPQDMVGFAQDLFEGWGVGDDELDNGLGVLLVEGMREIRFHTGYGIEGVLPDALCYQIQQRYMVPYFRVEDYSTGMVEGLRAVDAVLTGGELPRATEQEEGDTLLALLFVAMFILLPMLLMIVHERRKIKCPLCGKYKLRVVSRQRSRLSEMTSVTTTILHCDNCNTEHTRTEHHDDNHGGGGGIWIFPMGGFGGGRGMGGGSFGGGSFGGGGSGSSW